MRLLDRNSAGEFVLTNDFVDDDEVPPYAILSHTWVQGEEVTFEDLTSNTGKDKFGYEKIKFCGERARQDGLRYFWVDTCCINKANFTELSQAINSMFRWYQNATKCYVYLSDVSTTKRKASDTFSKFTWEPAFRKSRWFKRGWTLQELLAPGSVEFFSRDCRRLGDKITLESQIHEITKIAILALRRTPLSQFSVSERLSWAENRQTTRKEDKAYSMLGIFDIQIPLLYGEGEEKALKRLMREIGLENNLADRLPYAAEAPFNSYAKQHMPICLPNTRVDLLQEIYNWADRQDERSIFWLNGLTGTGKSTIAHTVARYYFDKKRLGASFFFSRGGGDVGHAGKFCTTVAIQLANNIPHLHQYIRDTIAEHSNIASLSLYDQWRQLVLRPLSKLNEDSYPSSHIIVIDALDECDNDNNILVLLSLLAEARLLNKIRLRVFLTSRPEIPIRHGFRAMPSIIHYDLALHDVTRITVDHDIAVFFRKKFQDIIDEFEDLPADWPGEDKIEQLVERADGLFIYAATVWRFIRGDGQWPPQDLLDLVIPSTRSSQLLECERDIPSRPPTWELDAIYTQILQHSFNKAQDGQNKSRLLALFKQVIGSYAVLIEPLSTAALAHLLHVRTEAVNLRVRCLHSVLKVPLNQNDPVRLVHPSFGDFLLDEKRCSDQSFWVDERQMHQMLAEGCIQLLSTSLKQDICGLNAPGLLVPEVQSCLKEQYLPPEFQYACLYWVKHFQKSGGQLRGNGHIYQFLQTHFLHWLEALSWMRKISEGILAIRSLESIALMCDCPPLHSFIHDMKRFALNCRPAIEQAPLQTYCSALIFAPLKSVVRKHFEDRIPKWIYRLHGVQEDWGALLQTLEGHTDRVSSVNFSPDGAMLVSSSHDNTIRLWDATTGEAMKTIEAHTRLVSSVAFSPNGALLVSASHDSTIKLWDATTGAQLKTLWVHTDRVSSVTFSPDSTLLASASASNDCTIRIWDTATGAVVNILEGHISGICSVAFSPDGVLLASASYDRTVRLWDAVTGVVVKILRGHTYWVHSVAFSPNGMLLASSSNDTTIRLWDAATGAIVNVLDGHTDGISAVAFSPDGAQLVSASLDKTIRLWDTTTGVAVKTLQGHTDGVRSVAFSPNGVLLASSSDDGTVRLWDAAMGAAIKMIEGHTRMVSAVAFSPDGALLVSASHDSTIRLWNTTTGKPLKTLRGHTNQVHSVIFSLDGSQLVSASNDNTARIWDAATGTLLETIALDFYRRVLYFGLGEEADSRLPFLEDLLGHRLHATPPQNLSKPQIYSDGCWVVRNSERVLWLPPEYRGCCLAFRSNVLALGHENGRVTIMELG